MQVSLLTTYHVEYNGLEVESCCLFPNWYIAGRRMLFRLHVVRSGVYLLPLMCRYIRIIFSGRNHMSYDNIDLLEVQCAFCLVYNGWTMSFATKHEDQCHIATASGNHKSTFFLTFFVSLPTQSIWKYYDVLCQPDENVWSLNWNLYAKNTQFQACQ